MCIRDRPGGRHPAPGRGRHHHQGIPSSVPQRVPHAAPGRAAAGDEPHLGTAGAEGAGRQAGYGGGEPAGGKRSAVRAAHFAGARYFCGRARLRPSEGENAQPG